MKTKTVIALLSIVFILALCAPVAKIVPTPTVTAVLSTPTFPPVPSMVTNTPTSTPKPTKTPIPIVYVTLGSPFAADCGDGIPRIWSNDSWNASGEHQFDNHHGHVDLFVPKGCNINSYNGEVVAPFNGYFSKVRQNIYNLDLDLSNHSYPTGIENALKFIGISNPVLSRVDSITLNFGHLKDNGISYGNVLKGQPLGDIVPEMGHHKLAYQIILVYQGKSFMMSPTLFAQENQPWPCVAGSEYDCVAEPNDFLK